MRFTKMHGAGNDYVYIDCFSESVPTDLPDLAQRIADRRSYRSGSKRQCEAIRSPRTDPRRFIFRRLGPRLAHASGGDRSIFPLGQRPVPLAPAGNQEKG